MLLAQATCRDAALRESDLRRDFKAEHRVLADLRGKGHDSIHRPFIHSKHSARRAG